MVANLFSIWQQTQIKLKKFYSNIHIQDSGYYAPTDPSRIWTDHLEKWLYKGPIRIIENHLLSHCDKIYTVHGGFAKLAGNRANKPITRINLQKIESPSQKTPINVKKEKTILRNNLMSRKLFSEENKFPTYIGVPKHYEIDFVRIKKGYIRIFRI